MPRMVFNVETSDLLDAYRLDNLDYGLLRDAVRRLLDTPWTVRIATRERAIIELKSACELINQQIKELESKCPTST